LSTRNIVPRADNEGGIGTTLKKWATGFIKVLTVDTINGATIDEAVAMSSKLTIPGAWTTPTFDAANFTASGGGSWTVESGDVTTYAYVITGKIMTVNFRIGTSTVAATANTLAIKVPASKTITKSFQVPFLATDNGTTEVGMLYAEAGQTVLTLYRNVAAAAWTACTNLAGCNGEITFEIN